MTMSRGHRASCALAASALVWASYVASAGATKQFPASQLAVFHVVGQPLTIGLPPTWDVVAHPAGTVFLAYNPTRTAYVSIQTQQTREAFSEWAKRFAESARQYNFSRDPKATVQTKRIRLPIGAAEEVIARLHANVGGSGLGMASYGYGFMHGGRAYVVTYVCPAASLQAFLGTFDASAAKIRPE
jgi:hypothetical protein